MEIPSHARDVTLAWRLRADILWIRCLLFLVGIPGITTPRPEVHYLLFDRYFRLAELYARRGDAKRAERLRRSADWHLERCDPEPPPRAALALSRPRRPTLTWVAGGKSKPPDHP